MISLCSDPKKLSIDALETLLKLSDLYVVPSARAFAIENDITIAGKEGNRRHESREMGMRGSEREKERRHSRSAHLIGLAQTKRILRLLALHLSVDRPSTCMQGRHSTATWSGMEVPAATCLPSCHILLH